MTARKDRSRRRRWVAWPPIWGWRTPLPERAIPLRPLLQPLLRSLLRAPEGWGCHPLRRPDVRRVRPLRRPFHLLLPLRRHRRQRLPCRRLLRRPQHPAGGARRGLGAPMRPGAAETSMFSTARPRRSGSGRLLLGCLPLGSPRAPARRRLLRRKQRPRRLPREVRPLRRKARRPGSPGSWSSTCWWRPSCWWFCISSGWSRPERQGGKLPAVAFTLSGREDVR